MKLFSNTITQEKPVTLEPDRIKSQREIEDDAWEDALLEGIKRASQESKPNQTLERRIDYD